MLLLYCSTLVLRESGTSKLPLLDPRRLGGGGGGRVAPTLEEDSDFEEPVVLGGGLFGYVGSKEKPSSFCPPATGRSGVRAGSGDGIPLAPIRRGGGGGAFEGIFNVDCACCGAGLLSRPGLGVLKLI